MIETKKTSIWTKGYVCAFIANVMLCFSQNSVSPLISTFVGTAANDPPAAEAPARVASTPRQAGAVVDEVFEEVGLTI